MGLIYADIELINGIDLGLAKRHMIGDEEVKRMHVNMLVDTGSLYMCINETVQQQLQLSVVEKEKRSLLTVPLLSLILPVLSKYVLKIVAAWSMLW